MAEFLFRLRAGKADLFRCTTVVNGNSAGGGYHVERFPTTLSIKSVVSGAAWYHTRHGRFLVEPESFLVLNHGQEYGLDIAAGAPAETLCPFFQPGLVEHVAHCLTTPVHRQLDDIAGEGSAAGFYERLYPKSGGGAARLARLRQGLRSPGASPGWLEEQLYGLAGELVRLNRQVCGEVASFPGSRAATRAELYRRLHRARDYIDSCYAEPLTVARLARVACLSPYHFQRMFKESFGQTPMQRLQAKRLQVAHRLVAGTELDITAVCLEVGFESLGTFSWLFRRWFGASPRAVRQSARRKTAR
jgi:AraC-like DNA-binding protein